MVMKRDEEPLVVLKGTGELFHQLPHHLQELVNDWCNLFGITLEVTASISRKKKKKKKEDSKFHTESLRSEFILSFFVLTLTGFVQES